MPGRADVMQQIHRELNLFARRVRVLVGRLHPDLSFVAYTLLSHISASGGCRVSDLAELYALDKSTVSRQVSDLVGRGLVERTDGPPRGLRVSAEGTRVLADASAQQLRALEDRVAGWSAADLRAFAAMLERFNAGS